MGQMIPQMQKKWGTNWRARAVRITASSTLLPQSNFLCEALVSWAMKNVLNEDLYKDEVLLASLHYLLPCVCLFMILKGPMTSHLGPKASRYIWFCWAIRQFVFSIVKRRNKSIDMFSNTKSQSDKNWVLPITICKTRWFIMWLLSWCRSCDDPIQWYSMSSCCWGFWYLFIELNIASRP